jgi:hypothetical protein
VNFFELHRTEDESGVSGTGVVAEGVEFTNRKCVLSWLTEHKSIAVYDSIEEVAAIHGHSGKTVIVYVGTTAWRDVPVTGGG